MTARDVDRIPAGTFDSPDDEEIIDAEIIEETAITPKQLDEEESFIRAAEIVMRMSPAGTLEISDYLIATTRSGVLVSDLLNAAVRAGRTWQIERSDPRMVYVFSWR